MSYELGSSSRLGRALHRIQIKRGVIPKALLWVLLGADTLVYLAIGLRALALVFIPDSPLGKLNGNYFTFLLLVYVPVSWALTFALKKQLREQATKI